MSRTRSTNRRDFLKTTGVAVAAVTGGVHSSLASAETTSPNAKLNMACIGTANRAAASVSAVSGEQIVAFCDVDQTYLDRAKTQFPNARTYTDYRELIEKEGGKIDAVTVATSDHHHVPASVRAMRAGKHVYCEKPLGHTVYEVRLMATEAKKNNVVTQMGTQIHAGNNYRRVVEMIQSGAIGDVTEVHVWCGKTWGGGERPEAGEQPPATLDWDLWIGPAPMRPFAKGRYHPAQWRKWWDFGNGTIGDMACHFTDLPFWALGLRHPTSAEAEGPEVHPETCPMGLKVRYEFPKEEGHGPLSLTWYDGNKAPKEINGERVPGSGVMFIGKKGMLFSDYNRNRLLPTEKFTDYEPPMPKIAASIGHHNEWIKAIKDNAPGDCTCNFDYSGALTETVLLGTVAYRIGKKIEWDAENLVATNCKGEAAKLINKDYRPGWEVD